MLSDAEALALLDEIRDRIRRMMIRQGTQAAALDMAQAILRDLSRCYEFDQGPRMTEWAAGRDTRRPGPENRWVVYTFDDGKMARVRQTLAAIDAVLEDGGRDGLA